MAKARINKDKTATATGARRPVRPGVRKLFRVAAVLLPLALLLGVEGVLRLRGHGGYPPLFRKVGPVDGGTLMLADQSGPISWFFANPDRPGHNDQYTFLTPKPTNTFRVFLAGESAMKGYPQPRNLASSAFLQAMLQDAWPERRVEIINLGTTAVASYPVLGMLTEALDYEPDLVIIHTGHNEFFGTYGVASIGRSGGQTWSLPLTRFVHSLAIVQAYQKSRRAKGAELEKSLMEIMVGDSFIPPEDARRSAAERNLHHNLAAMLQRCGERNVPALVCTLPTNERDLAPVGRPPAATVGGTNAVEHFKLGRTLFVEGRTNEARGHFIAARDLDTMPWRAPSTAQEAIRRAAREQGALVCNLEDLFRAHSPGGCIGWELMDDHVHPTLRGQALMAEGFLQAMTQLEGPARLTPDAQSRVADWEHYAQQLGDNPYDRYGVAHSMRILFEVPFMRSSNPEGFARLNQICTDFEQQADPEVLPVLREWQTYRPHAGAKRPLSGMVARVFLRQGKNEAAMQLYEIARRAVPEYTSWHLEYTYFMLVAREKLRGALSEEDRQLARREIEQGRVLLQRGFSETGFTERHMARLHQLRGEFAEAIPYLQVSRQKLSGLDLVAADQALVVSYLRLKQFDRARELATHGARNAGQYAPLYQKMLAEIPALERAAESSSATHPPVTAPDSDP